MSHKWPAQDDKVELQHMSPFWAVMIGGRDTPQMVNMTAYMEEYKIPHPVAKNYGEMKMSSSLTVRLPFLTNKNDVAAGELLVLPCDGGLAEICFESFPPLIHGKSAMSHSALSH